MKIANAETIWLSIPMRQEGPPSGFGGRNWTKLDILIVKIETDEGITGYGEAFGHNAIPATKAAFDSMIAPLLLGRDATQIPTLMTELQKTLHNFGRYGQTLFALSGLDIALWDIAAKAAGLPLHRLIGGATQESLPAYASLLRYGEPDAVGERVRAAVDEGYRYIKLHERTVEAVRAAREAAGPDVAIMVDVNCPWTVQESLRMAEAFAPYDIYWLEEPVWPPENFAGLADVTLGSSMPIAAGENASTLWEFKAMLEQGAVTYAQPSVTKVGGITEFRKIMALAEAYNVAVVPHCPYFGAGFIATVHLMAGTNEPIERLYVKLETNPYGELVNARDGRVQVPTTPGVAPVPDPDVIKEYRVG